MPNNDFTTKLLELEDVILSDVQSSNTEIHVYFTMIQKTHKCPRCGNLTNHVHDYRTSIIKDIPFMGKKFCIIKNVVITAILVVNTSTNLAPLLENTVA